MYMYIPLYEYFHKYYYKYINISRVYIKNQLHESSKVIPYQYFPHPNFFEMLFVLDIPTDCVN